MRHLLLESNREPGATEVVLNVVDSTPHQPLVRTQVAVFMDEAAARLFWEAVACLKAAARETGRQGL